MAQSAMGSKTLFIILFSFLSCGKQVEISNEKLRYSSSLSNGSTTSANLEGTLQRGAKDQITVNGSTYTVSRYSSYLALEFIAAKPLNSSQRVKFRGKYQGQEVLLEIIEAQ